MTLKIIPAIIAKSQIELEKKINLVKDYASIIQLDIMDGIFVANESLNFNFKLPKTDCEFEAHLMVDNPDDWVERNWQKVDTVIIPIESCEKPKEFIKFFTSPSTRLGASNKKIGFALNPETPLEAINDYLDKINQVLIMTVHPGFYGARFLPETLEKVRQLRKLKPDLDIEVDGGITKETIREAFSAGANLLVSGSYIINSKNPKEAINRLSSALKT